MNSHYDINNETVERISSLQPLINNPNIGDIRLMTNQSVSEMFKSGNLKDIPGYEGFYAASKDGRIWSYPNRRNGFNGMWMKQQLCINTKNRNKPKCHYSISMYKNKKVKRKQVHRLVGLTFVPNPNSLPQINHKDGNPTMLPNNDVSNLEWATRKQNMQHAIKKGLFDIHSGKQDKTRSKNGKKTGAINGIKSRRIFSMPEVDCIRKIHEIGNKSFRSIAKVYNCSDKTIGNMCNYKSYVI